MRVYTIGFTKRSAEEFFETLRGADVKRILDVRLQNTSQLAGFTKKEDLPYFLDRLLGADYVHEPLLAPTEENFKAYRSGEIEWTQFRTRFLATARSRKIESAVDWRVLLAKPSVLLCGEPEPDRCHRSLVLEYLTRKGVDLQPTHL